MPAAQPAAPATADEQACLCDFAAMVEAWWTNRKKAPAGGGEAAKRDAAAAGLAGQAGQRRWIQATASLSGALPTCCLLPLASSIARLLLELVGAAI